jgi:alpha,alpha-trehalase
VDTGFASDGTIREKYNVVSSSANVEVSAGYKVNVIGFGWTNSVYLKMKQVMEEK